MPVKGKPVDAALLCSVIIGVVVVLFIAELPRLREPIDFGAFRCGGASLWLHQNPYLERSLHVCESQTLRDFSLRLTAPTLPAPFPSYTLALFSLISLVPATIGFVLWSLLLFAAFLASVYILRGLTKLPYPLLIGSMSPSLLTVALPLGQVVPLIVFACVLCAWGAQREKPYAVAVACMLAMIEPNVGLPLCLAAFVLVPKARGPIFGGAILLAAVALFVMPIGEQLQYLRDVLPAHGLSEAFDDDQYGFTHALVLLHLDPALAVRIASLSYIGLVSCGVGGAVSIARRTKDIALAITFAAVAPLIAEPYLHIQQMEIATVLAILFYYRERSMASIAALTIVALPFSATRTLTEVIAFPIVAAVIAVSALPYRNLSMVKFLTGGSMALALLGLKLRATTYTDQAYHKRALTYLSLHADRIPPIYPEYKWQEHMIHVSSRFGALAECWPILMIGATAYIIIACYRTKAFDRSAPAPTAGSI